MFVNLIGSKSMSFSVCAYESECVFVNVTGSKSVYLNLYVRKREREKERQGEKEW